MKKEIAVGIGVTLAVLVGGGVVLARNKKKGDALILATGEEPPKLLPPPKKEGDTPQPTPVPRPDPVHVIIKDGNGDGLYREASETKHWNTWYGRGKLISLSKNQYAGWQTGRETTHMMELQGVLRGARHTWWVHKDSVDTIRGNDALKNHFAKTPANLGINHEKNQDALLAALNR